MGKRNNSFEEKTIKSETIYKGRIVDLRVETVELPDMKYAKREIVDHARGACIIPVKDNGKIIMVKQYRKAVNDFVLEMPAGLVEVNEDPSLAANRELQEEIGYKSNKLKFLFDGYASPGFTNEKNSFFLALDLEKSELDLDENEYLEVVEYDLKDLVSMLEACEITDMKTIVSILYLQSVKDDLFR